MVIGDDVVLEVRDLVRHFPITRGVLARKQIGTVKAVDGVSLTLERGETLGLVGESGCGKSTLARIVMALDRPTSGQVLLHGRDVFALSSAQMRGIRRDIQIVLQDPYTSLNPRMTVGDIVGEPFDIHPDATPSGGRRAAVQELLELVGLNPDHLNRYPHQFSGGQRQRIGVARALALRPSVIICDEPVSALDLSVQAQVINLLSSLQREFGLSYLFIAHDLSVVRHVSDHLAVMYLGKIVENGSAVDIYDRATHPYTQALLSAVPSVERRRAGHQRIVLEGDVPSPADPPSGCAFRTRCWKAEDICARDVPALEERSTSRHPSACHFARELIG